MCLTVRGHTMYIIGPVFRMHKVKVEMTSLRQLRWCLAGSWRRESKYSTQVESESSRFRLLMWYVQSLTYHNTSHFCYSQHQLQWSSCERCNLAVLRFARLLFCELCVASHSVSPPFSNTLCFNRNHDTRRKRQSPPTVGPEKLGSRLFQVDCSRKYPH